MPVIRLVSMDLLLETERGDKQGFRQKKIYWGGTIRKHKFAKKGNLSSEHFLEGLH